MGPSGVQDLFVLATIPVAGRVGSSLVAGAKLAGGHVSRLFKEAGITSGDAALQLMQSEDANMHLFDPDWALEAASIGCLCGGSSESRVVGNDCKRVNGKQFQAWCKTIPSDNTISKLR